MLSAIFLRRKLLERLVSAKGRHEGRDRAIEDVFSNNPSPARNKLSGGYNWRYNCSSLIMPTESPASNPGVSKSKGV